MKSSPIRTTFLAAVAMACGTTLLPASSSARPEDVAASPNVVEKDAGSSAGADRNAATAVDNSDETVNAIKSMTIDTRDSVAASIEVSRKSVDAILADLRRHAAGTGPKVQRSLIELMARVEGVGNDLEHDLVKLREAEASDIPWLRQKLASEFQEYVALAARARASIDQLQ